MRRLLANDDFVMSSPVSEKQVVYVVDDDDSLRKALTRLLRAAGFEVRAYASAGDFVFPIAITDVVACYLMCGCPAQAAWIFRKR